jgi:hypothetical protein
MTMSSLGPLDFSKSSLPGLATQKSETSRWRACAIHMVISIALAICVVSLLYFFWYPKPFFEASGGQFLLMVLVGVDVILGPLITLIIFDAKKKYLRLDLTIIALIQLMALSYGTYTMYAARPVFVVFSGEQFNVVPANDIELKMLADVTRREFKSLPLSGPKYVYNDPPASFKDPSSLLLSIDGLAPQFYVPYAEKSAAAAMEGKPLTDLLKRKPNERAKIDEALRLAQHNATDVIFFPMTAKIITLTVLADQKSGEILAVLPLNPL